MKYIEGSIPFEKDGNYRVWSKYDGWVILSKERWEHALARHPESQLEMNWQKISDTLQNPDHTVVEDNTRVYYKKFAVQVKDIDPNSPMPEDLQYFTVIIQIVNKFILTIFEQEDIKKRHKPKDENK